jgi:hypothetical protein
MQYFQNHHVPVAVGLAPEDNSRTVCGHLYLGPALHGDLQVQEEAE